MAAKPPRLDLTSRIEQVAEVRRELLRRMILQHRRIDVLAEVVLGYEVAPHHLQMIQNQIAHPRRNLALVFRGAGKTTIRTVVYAIWRLLKNPDWRIAVASKSTENAVTMLREMREQIEKNETFRMLFGDLVGSQWEERRFSIKGRTKPRKEANVTALGVEAAVVSQHYDEIIGDDLVDEENSRTDYMRKRLRTWFHRSLMPCLEPEGNLSEHGTHYHSEDLYVTQQKTMFAGPRTVKIPLIQEDPETGLERSSWPQHFSLERCREIRTETPIPDFLLQYQLESEVVALGDIFTYHDFPGIVKDDIPEGLPVFVGVDLAVSKERKADRFATVTISWDRGTGMIYLLHSFCGKLKPSDQRDYVVELDRKFSPARITIEKHAYQDAMIKDLKQEHPDLPVFGRDDKNAKLARALQIQVRCAAKKIVCGPGNDKAINEIVGFPDAEHDDFVDAFYFALLGTKFARERTPRPEPGLIGF